MSMSYENFKEVVVREFTNYLPEQYRDMELHIASCDKVNRKLDGITLISNGASKGASPTIYINDMYNDYLLTEDLQKVLEDAAALMETTFAKLSVVDGLDFKNAKDNIVFQVINTTQNQDMLKNMPHREFLDLSIIYRWIVATDEDGIQSTIINNSVARRLEMNEEQLFRCAVENTRRLLPPTVRSINDILCEMITKNDMPEAMFEMLDAAPADKMMYVISNDRGINGAASMLYEDNLHSLAENLGTDLYILPSSVHECIAVSANLGDPYELAAMVNEINMSEVALDERLSNQVYHYNKDLRKLTLATDTPNKFLA